MEIKDSDLHRLIDQYEDDHAEAAPDEDGLRAAFAANPHWTRQPAADLTEGQCLAVVVGAVVVAALILLLLPVVTG